MVKVEAYGTCMLNDGKEVKWSYTFHLNNDKQVLMDIKRLAKRKLIKMQPGFTRVMTQNYTMLDGISKRRVIDGVENLLSLDKAELIVLAEMEAGLDPERLVGLSTSRIAELVYEELSLKSVGGQLTVGKEPSGEESESLDSDGQPEGGSSGEVANNLDNSKPSMPPVPVPSVEDFTELTDEEYKSLSTVHKRKYTMAKKAAANNGAGDLKGL